MDCDRLRAVVDAGKSLDFLPSGILGVTRGEFLSDLPRDDDFPNQTWQRTQAAGQGRVEVDRRASVDEGHASCGRR